MQAKDTYKIFRAVVGTWLKENGFKSLGSNFPVYQKAYGGRFVTVKCRCHSNGWDKYKGSSFCVWFKHSQDSEIDDGMRYSLAWQLTLPEREFIRARNNRLVATIPAPPPGYIEAIVNAFQKTFGEPQVYIDSFLKDWRQVTQPYSPDENIWFRYTSEDDVRSWALLTLNHIKQLHERIVSPAA